MVLNGGDSGSQAGHVALSLDNEHDLAIVTQSIALTHYRYVMAISEMLFSINTSKAKWEELMNLQFSFISTLYGLAKL